MISLSWGVVSFMNCYISSEPTFEDSVASILMAGARPDRNSREQKRKEAKNSFAISGWICPFNLRDKRHSQGARPALPLRSFYCLTPVRSLSANLLA